MTHYQFYTLLAAICAARFFPRWLSAIGCIVFGVMAFRGAV